MLELYLIGTVWPEDVARTGGARSAADQRDARSTKSRAASTQRDGRSDRDQPLVRARQTASFRELKSKPPIATSDALAPAGSPPAVIQEITKHVRKARVALVGHEPNLGELAALLIGARSPFEFKKGGICRIDFDMLPPKGGGMLRWFLTPKMLRALGD